MSTVVPRVPPAPAAAPFGQDSQAAAFRVALVLGGGAITGGAYGTGALRALDLLLAGRTINDFDVYVGTSSGSLLAALAANGVSSLEMMQVLIADPPKAFPGVDPGTLLTPNLGGLLRTGVMLPRRALELGWRVASRRDRGSLIDGLLRVLPAGLYSTRGIERYLREILMPPARSDDFRELERELYLAATDLDSCERLIFGEPGWDDVPISRAVAASTALPVLYAPVRVRDRDLVDGGVSSTTNLDVAVAHGARLVIVVNPLVPYRVPPAGPGQPRTRRFAELAFTQIAYQCFKLLVHQRLHEMRGLWEQRYPGVEIVLIEPAQDDEVMFETSPISYGSRAEIAWRGFKSVTDALAGDEQGARDACARYGLELSPAPLRELLERAAS